MAEKIWSDAPNSGERLFILFVAIAFVCISFGSILVASLAEGVLFMFYLFLAITIMVIIMLLIGVFIVVKNPILVEITSDGITLPSAFKRKFIAKGGILSVKIGQYGDVISSGRLSVLPKPFLYSFWSKGGVPPEMNIIEIKTEKETLRRKVNNVNGLAENLKRIGIEIKQKEGILVWEKS